MEWQLVRLLSAGRTSTIKRRGILLALCTIIGYQGLVSGAVMRPPNSATRGPLAVYLAPDERHVFSVWQNLDATSILVCCDSLGRIVWKKAFGYGALHVRSFGLSTLVVRHSHDQGLELKFLSWKTGVVQRELHYTPKAMTERVAIVDSTTLLAFVVQGESSTTVEGLRVLEDTVKPFFNVKTKGLCVGRRYFAEDSKGYVGVGNVGPIEDALLEISTGGVRRTALGCLRSLDEFYGGSLTRGRSVYAWARWSTEKNRGQGVTVKAATHGAHGLDTTILVGEHAGMNTVWDISGNSILLGIIGTADFSVVPISKGIPTNNGH